jgi:hypothetical protein
MAASHVLSTLRRAALATAAGALVLAPASLALAAPATVTRFIVVHDPEIFTASAFCLPEDLLGTVTTQEVSSEKSVETSSGVFQINGVDDFSYRIDFPDGSYVEAGIDRDLFSFVGNPSGFQFTRVTQDFETIHASDGTAVGKLALNGILHTSWHDADRDGVPDEGELTTQVDHFRIRCP